MYLIDLRIHLVYLDRFDAEADAFSGVDCHVQTLSSTRVVHRFLRAGMDFQSTHGEL